MAIIATFTEGQTCVTVNGLHQWDFGQTLEIHDDTLPAMIEVHFGYPGAREAVVRVASAVNGKPSVAIPDVCLEQPAPVMAWIYEVVKDAEQVKVVGRTIRTVVLPLVARVRPAVAEEVLPEELTNKYTEAVGAMNAAVEQFKQGDVKVGDAVHADEASHADTASKAVADQYGREIGNTYATFDGSWTPAGALPGAGTYLVLLYGVPFPEAGVQYLVKWDGESAVELPGYVNAKSWSTTLVSMQVATNGQIRYNATTMSIENNAVGTTTTQAGTVFGFDYLTIKEG